MLIRQACFTLLLRQSQELFMNWNVLVEAVTELWNV
jgi:hypothetical protein